MADILIRGMEMPQNCIDCMFTTIDCDMCILEKNDLMLCGGRPSWCPLLPLPKKHGRLIDAGVFRDQLIELARAGKGAAEIWVILFIAEMLNNAPTIVPAEGGGEDG